MDEATVLEVLAQMTKAAVAERADGSDEAGRDRGEDGANRAEGANRGDDVHTLNVADEADGADKTNKTTTAIRATDKRLQQRQNVYLRLTA